jgi:hypothetical protein
MEETSEQGKELLHYAHANGMNGIDSFICHLSAGYWM